MKTLLPINTNISNELINEIEEHRHVTKREWKEWYQYTYLKSDYWVKLRNIIISECHIKCKKCDKFDGTLNVHHFNYRNLGCENRDDLIVVCPECHSALHPEHKVKKKRAKKSKVKTKKITNVKSLKKRKKKIVKKVVKSSKFSAENRYKKNMDKIMEMLTHEQYTTLTFENMGYTVNEMLPTINSMPAMKDFSAKDVLKTISDGKSILKKARDKKWKNRDKKIYTFEELFVKEKKRIEK